MSHLDTGILKELAEGVEAGRYPEDLIRRFLERPWLVSSVYRNERKLWEIPAGQEVLGRVWTANLSHAAWQMQDAERQTVVRTSAGKGYAYRELHPTQLTLTPSGMPLCVISRWERTTAGGRNVPELYVGEDKHHASPDGLETFACFDNGDIATLSNAGDQWAVAFGGKTRQFPNNYHATRWEHTRCYDYRTADRQVPNPRPRLYVAGSWVFCWIPGDGLYACSVDPPQRLFRTASDVVVSGYPEHIGAVHHRATDQMLWYDDGEEGTRPAGRFCNGKPVTPPCANIRTWCGFLQDGALFFRTSRHEGAYPDLKYNAEIYLGERTISVQGPDVERVFGRMSGEVVLVLTERRGTVLCAPAPDQTRVDSIVADAPRFDRVEDLQYAGDRGVAFIGMARKRCACYLMDWTGHMVQQGPQYRGLRRLAVSPDAAHWAAIASNRDERGVPQFVVVDGAAGRLHPAIEQVVWYDSATLRYLVNKAPEQGCVPQYCAYEVALGKEDEAE